MEQKSFLLTGERWKPFFIHYCVIHFSRYQFQRYCEFIIDLATDASKYAEHQAEFHNSRANQIQTFANFIGHPVYLEKAMNLTDEWLERLGKHFFQDEKNIVFLVGVQISASVSSITIQFLQFLRFAVTENVANLRIQ